MRRSGADGAVFAVSSVLCAVVLAMVPWADRHERARVA